MQIMTLHGPEKLTVSCSTSGSICFGADGTGVAEAMIKRMQSTLNRFAAQVGMSPSAIDGKVGDGTIRLAQRVIEMATFKYGLSYVTLAPKALTKRQLAENADFVNEKLSELAASMNLPIPAAPKSDTSPSASIPSDLPIVDPSLQPAAHKAPMWPWFAAAGLLVTGIGTAIFLQQR